jgi:hypothetical protein
MGNPSGQSILPCFVIKLSGSHVVFVYFGDFLFTIKNFLVAILYQVVEIPSSSPLAEKFYHISAQNCVKAFSSSIE